ncbi:hypothetical protein ACWCYY_06250 [Kitasatospora sp. NPDC001664]|uniref:hypothetical protein n=1 Tax=Kitasatospora albolonga TaxID=68173 RepID=UPI0031E5C47A
MATDELRADGPVTAWNTSCGRCEQADGLSPFTERRTSVTGTRGVLRFLGAAVLTVTAVELLLLGSPTAATVLLALAATAAAGCAVAVRRARGETVTVLHCPHCLTRTEV